MHRMSCWCRASVPANLFLTYCRLPRRPLISESHLSQVLAAQPRQVAIAGSGGQSNMQLTACGTRGAVQLTKAAAGCVRTIASTSAPRATLLRQAASPAAQLGQSSFVGGQCAQLAGGVRRVAQQQAGSRGFRSSTITMGLKTGIVGLPNVGKVSQSLLSRQLAAVWRQWLRHGVAPTQALLQPRAA